MNTTQMVAASLGSGSQEQFLPQLRAETYPSPSAIALSWDLPLEAKAVDFPDPDELGLFVLRREGRFPGTNRRGSVPVQKQLVTLPSGVQPEDRSRMPGADLTGAEDGLLVYNTVTAAFEFDFEEQWNDQTEDRRIVTWHQYRYQGNPGDRVLVRRLRQELAWSAAHRDWMPQRFTVQWIDRDGLKPGTIYYYTAFVGSDYYFSRQTQAAALAVGPHGHQIFQVLPQIHQQLDTVWPNPELVALGDRSKGQLQRFLEVFEAHADMLHGTIKALQDIHNIRRADSRLLPPMADLIGWRFKNLENELKQRQELTFTPKLYSSTGAFKVLESIIHLLTGWRVEIREFSHNVLTSFDSKRLEKISGRSVYLDGSLKPTSEYLLYLSQRDDYLQRQEQDLLEIGETEPQKPPVLQCWQGRQWDSDTPHIPLGSINLDTADPSLERRRAQLYTKTQNDSNVYSYHAPLSEEDREKLLYENKGLNIKALYNQQSLGIYLHPGKSEKIFSLEEIAEDVDRFHKILKEFIPINVKAFIFIQPIDIEEFYNLDKEILIDSGISKISWIVIHSNQPGHCSVDTKVSPISKRYRSWFTGATLGSPEGNSYE